MPRAATHRLALTLHLNEYERVRAHARRAGRPVAAVAKRLLLGAVDGQDPDTAAAVHGRERDRIHELEAETARLQAQLAQRQAAADLEARLPRWRWPLETLLADRTWWDEWLPLLGELIGRNLEYDRAYGDRQPRPIVDDRGFADLMGYLFPDLKGERGQSVPWHSREYPRLARVAWSHALAGSPLRQRPHRAEVWEPVVRHVARALTALETTSQAPSDAYAHLRSRPRSAASGCGPSASCSAWAPHSARTICHESRCPDRAREARKAHDPYLVPYGILAGCLDIARSWQLTTVPGITRRSSSSSTPPIPGPPHSRPSTWLPSIQTTSSPSSWWSKRRRSRSSVGTTPAGRGPQPRTSLACCTTVRPRSPSILRWVPT
jgi:hypothetical protein